MTMNDIELSFCIPTYNRVHVVSELVASILSSTDPFIEVVVLDNGSTDGTLDVLGAIKDNRLRVYGNGENKGALFNMVNVLDRGRGKFLVYSTDQDHVDSARISDFKGFLMRHPDLAGGYCAFGSPSEVEFEMFKRGYQAIRKIAYQGRHPTGYFFNNRMLKPIKLVERFSDYDMVDLFPLEFAFAELCSSGDGAIYHRPVFIPETGAAVVKHTSATTNGKSKRAFFAPEARLKLAISYAKHIVSLPLLQSEKHELISETFVNELAAATRSYQAILRNERLCAHYRMESKEIGTLDLLRIGLGFYWRYKCETRTLWGSRLIMQMRFESCVFAKIFQRIARRFTGSRQSHSKLFR